MNDHIDPNQIAKVKEWAEDRLLGKATSVHLNAVAEVITAMPDQIIDADRVRELANLHRKWGEEGSWAPKTINIHTQIAEVLESLLPPSLPTLTDLIEQGHDTAQYQWMQADHRDERCIIVRMDGHTSQPTVSLLTATGSTIWVSPDEVIPLPGLPRLVWPASEREPAEETPTPEVAPKVLVTEEDYESAPYGTIITEGRRLPFFAGTWAWHYSDGRTYDHSFLAGTPRSVLRWGMGEQA